MGGWRVVNTASIRSLVGAESAAYSASKVKIGQVTKAMTVEVAGKSMRVNVIAPRIIETEMTVETRISSQRLSSYLATVPLGRCGTPKGPAVRQGDGWVTMRIGWREYG